MSKNQKGKSDKELLDLLKAKQGGEQ